MPAASYVRKKAALNGNLDDGGGHEEVELDDIRDAIREEGDAGDQREAREIVTEQGPRQAQPWLKTEKQGSLDPTLSSPPGAAITPE